MPKPWMSWEDQMAQLDREGREKRVQRALEPLIRKGEQREQRLKTDPDFRREVAKYDDIPAEVRKLFAALHGSKLPTPLLLDVRDCMAHGYVNYGMLLDRMWALAEVRGAEFFDPSLKPAIDRFRAHSAIATALKAREIVAILKASRIHVRDEAGLQSAVETLLPGARREVETDRGRIDFVLGDVAIELKVAGSNNAVMRQLKRYAELSWVREVVLVTTCAKHRMPPYLSGKPVYVVMICGL
jgi:hypothetical protein